jgi:hypothetical protein
MRRFAVAVLGVVALACAAASPAVPAVGHELLEPYAGLGAWISIYDRPPWRTPERAVAELASRGVHTLYLQTGNYRQSVDVVQRGGVARFIRAAHSYGIQVVAWYLPSLTDPARDLRRAVAALDFSTSDGQRFDSFALDVESTAVRSLTLRNARAVALARDVRRAAGPGFPLGAITIAPVGASPTYWPGFPFRGLSRHVDVLLPMAYFTARVHGAAQVRAYLAANVRLLRAQAGDAFFPIHAIGGVTPHARPAETRAFAAAAVGCGSLGASLWEFGTMKPADWAALQPLATRAEASASPASC